MSSKATRKSASNGITIPPLPKDIPLPHIQFQTSADYPSELTTNCRVLLSPSTHHPPVVSSSRLWGARATSITSYDRVAAANIAAILMSNPTVLNVQHAVQLHTYATQAGILDTHPMRDAPHFYRGVAAVISGDYLIAIACFKASQLHDARAWSTWMTAVTREILTDMYIQKADSLSSVFVTRTAYSLETVATACVDIQTLLGSCKTHPLYSTAQEMLDSGYRANVRPSQSCEAVAEIDRLIASVELKPPTVASKCVSTIARTLSTHNK